MIILFFIFGLIIGSFLNALLHRLGTNESVAQGRSKCPKCGHELSPYDLVPVLSFVWLAGKCRYCHKPISWMYPLIELTTGAVFALIGLRFSFQISEELLFSVFIASVLIVVAVFDLRHYLILDKVIFPASGVAFGQLLYESYKLHTFGLHSPLVGGLIGTMIISGFFAAQFFISKGKWIGFGDVKFGILLGLLSGVGKGLLLLFLSYCAGAIVGIVLMMLGRKHLGSRLPFGTFLAFCGIIVIVYGDAILSWYLGLIGF